ncbi:MAG: hypothetical protein ACI4IF_03565 [Acutalibacteraceae bacterium]
MKKTVLVLCLLIILSAFTACADKEAEKKKEPTTAETTVTTEKAEKIQIIVKKSEVSNPDDFKSDIESFGGIVSEDGAEDAFGITFTQEQYNNLLNSKRQGVKDKYETLLNDPESGITALDYDDDFRVVKVAVNKDIYSKNQGEVTNKLFDLAAYGLSYQFYINENKRVRIVASFEGEEEPFYEFALPLSQEVSD